MKTLRNMLSPATPCPVGDKDTGWLGVTIVVGLLSVLPTLLQAQGGNAIHKMIEPKPNVAAASLSLIFGTCASRKLKCPSLSWLDLDRQRSSRAHGTDVRAMRPHDLISVVVSESLAASTDGTVKNSRASNANSSVSALFGALHTGNALQNLSIKLRHRV